MHFKTHREIPLLICKHPDTYQPRFEIKTGRMMTRCQGCPSEMVNTGKYGVKVRPVKEG